MNIAIYGKGGIGKSTIASCVSVFLATKGKKVLQVGCDPKHDSTLILLGKKRIKTIIEAIDSDDCLEDDIVVEGVHGIDCVEIGGPMPGVECAGRGIITGLSRLEEIKKYKSRNYDHIIYDVLGDVVCGGFFEPLKRKKVDKMYIVTSGEFNSIFAANNLCKGYCNCNLANKQIVLAGVIGNCRGIPNEEQIISEFCKRVNIPLVSIIPRNHVIEECTIAGSCVIDSNIAGDVVNKIKSRVDDIERNTVVYDVNSLTLNELRQMFKELIW